MEEQKLTWSVQFKYEYGMEALVSHWEKYDNREDMEIACSEWQQKGKGHHCAVYESGSQEDIGKKENDEMS